ncbi:carboxymuconolactone decarboxylase family protein [Arthrobacter ramosus]|uniref:Carboxymuconolactone decarboxylase family protein n=1 Tax=Arthrobacter ramosus TaxID=1672 RepID=A0ABV5XX31_ARTRM|nr:carboxymuconolactone decarboxylase family protein [Arthrobacter ramosus]
MDLTPRQQEVKQNFIDVRGSWSHSWEAILALSPEFLSGYLSLSSVPWTKNRLEDKIKEFIYIAVDSAATHMYLPGVRQHVKAALRLGASSAEIMEVVELASTLGVHAMNVGVPILCEVLDESGMRPAKRPPTEDQEKVKKEFTQNRGCSNKTWDDILELDPEYVEAYAEFSSASWKYGPLAPKVKEFIYIACDTAATHLYERGTKLHMENALHYGATVEEIIEVLEIASVIGIHAATTAAPIILEEIAAFEAEKTAS